MSELARFQHPRFARLYTDVSAEADLRGGSQHRRLLLAGLRGRVIEIGAGHGLNFSHYPPEVSQVLAIEPDDTLRVLAERAAATAQVPVQVVAGHAEALPAPDSTLDAAVVSLVLCSVPDQAEALAEIRRVLAPGGQLRFYEHVRSAGRLRGLLEDVITPVWTRIAGGCHPNRETGSSILAAGFTIDKQDQFGFRPARLGPSSTHLIGSAHLDEPQ